MVEVFKYDGTLQCGQGKEEPLEVGTSCLEKLGAKVLKAEKRQMPGMVAQKCGIMTGMCNVYTLDDESWWKTAKAVLGAGFGIWPDSLVSLQDWDGPWPFGVKVDGEVPWPFAVAMAAQGKGAAPQNDWSVWPFAKKSMGKNEVLSNDWTVWPLNIGMKPKGRKRAAANSADGPSLKDLSGFRLRVVYDDEFITQEYFADRLTICLARKTSRILNIWIG